MARTIGSKFIAYFTTMTARASRPVTRQSAPDWQRLLQSATVDDVVPAVWPPERGTVSSDLPQAMPFGDLAE